MDLSWILPTAASALNLLVLAIWKPWANAYAAEKAKNFARKEDLEPILNEVRAVFAAQKEIEAAFQRANWNYQTFWTHQMSAYSAVIGGMFDIRDRLLRLLHANLDSDRDPNLLGEFEKCWAECTAQMTIFNRLVAAAILVGDEETEKILSTAKMAVAIAFQPSPQGVQRGIKELDAQCTALLKAAKKRLDFHQRVGPLGDNPKPESHKLQRINVLRNGSPRTRLRVLESGHNILMPNTNSALAAAKLEKEQALAKLRVLQSGALDGKLLDRDQVKAQWSAAFAALRDRAMGMADRVTQRGAGRTSEELRAIVDAEVREMLEAVSRGEL